MPGKNRRARKREQRALRLKLFYLSFCGDEGWKGACFVEAADGIAAAQKSWELGCNPGGQVLMCQVTGSAEDRLPGPEMMNRLLNEKELRTIWPDAKRVGDLPGEVEVDQ